ncbi:unnamed protein product [Polarella glacialis]|uniref:Uncharacterized protein n=1 Tax=Polarella glacialis TaxID=89957 RepID=A0A813JYJ5_POLGL|nr:unnamed protein product [Polarella glacialis]
MLAFEIANSASVQPMPGSIPKCQRLHGLLKRSGAELLRDWARANDFVRDALQQALAVPDEFELTAEGICGGDSNSRMIRRCQSPTSSSHLKTTCLFEDSPR